jgi:ABC-2 type transport system permease protein/oleandomycin transport system permease protein
MSIAWEASTTPSEGTLLQRARGDIRDTIGVAQRNLIGLMRTPQLVVFATIQPIIFVLMFRYVFGGAITVIGIDYVDFLMPGIFVQTTVFGAMGAAIGLASDVKSGLLERFRSLPMGRSAVLGGRTIADLARNVFVVILMALVGFAVGFRVHSTAMAFLLGMLLVLLFGFALSWVFAALGLAVGDPETAQAAAFPLMAPLVFASSAFVPVATMPGWLQPFAEHQPVSVTATAVRNLCLGIPASSYVWQSIAWSVGIFAFSAILAVRKYRQAD